MSNVPGDPPELGLTRARRSLLHALANCVGIMSANLDFLRGMPLPAEAVVVLDDVRTACERAMKNFEALRKLL